MTTAFGRTEDRTKPCTPSTRSAFLTWRLYSRVPGDGCRSSIKGESRPMRYANVDLFAVTLVVAIFAVAYSRPRVTFWMAHPVPVAISGPLNGQYSTYGVFATFLVAETTLSSKSDDIVRLEWLGLTIELACIFVILFLTITAFRLVLFFYNRTLEMRHIDRLIQNGPDKHTM
jgi:hypothetical protein